MGNLEGYFLLATKDVESLAKCCEVIFKNPSFRIKELKLVKTDWLSGDYKVYSNKMNSKTNPNYKLLTIMPSLNGLVKQIEDLVKNGYSPNEIIIAKQLDNSYSIYIEKNFEFKSPDTQGL